MFVYDTVINQKKIQILTEDKLNCDMKEDSR